MPHVRSTRRGAGSRRNDVAARLTPLNEVDPPEPGDAEPSSVFYREAEAAGPLREELGLHA